jgi:FkbM family methyltransferase
MSISPKINGINYIINNDHDIIEHKLSKGNQWNTEIFEILKLYISQRNLHHFLNVGCHIGSVCLPISLLIDKVTAIEAYPPTYNHLCKNINLNKITNVNSLNIALGFTEEEIYFLSEEKICPVEHINRVINNTGGMHVLTENDIKNNVRSSCLTDKKIKNKMKKLDNIEVDNFDLLLVDIEGSEYHFLLGAKDKIIKNKPIIIIEIWNDNKRRSEKMRLKQNDIITYIIRLGYKLINSIGDDFIFEPL